MPKKPKRPCSHPGCPNLTDGRFCEEHEKLANQNYEKYGRIRTAKEDMAEHGKGYVINMYHSIRSVKFVMPMGFWWRQRKSTIRNR